MSYATMDHAAWALDNIRAGKSQATKAATRRKLAAKRTSGYLAAPDDLSPFQAKVFDILGMVGGGIYNAPIAWERIQWAGWGGDAIAVPYRDTGSMATFDSSRLTRLVFLCHEARIRCEIRTHTFGYFLLCFWQRGADGGMARRHPSLDEAVTEFHDYLPTDHRIIHRVPTDAGQSGRGCGE